MLKTECRARGNWGLGERSRGIFQISSPHLFLGEEESGDLLVSSVLLCGEINLNAAHPCALDSSFSQHFFVVGFFFEGGGWWRLEGV